MFLIAIAHALVIVASAAEQQTPIAPIRIASIGGDGNPITISVTGVEQDPAPIKAAWNPDDRCLGDVACYVASWIAGNASADQQQLMLLRAPDERADLEQRIKRDPRVLTLSADRFKATRSWHLLGWIEYGPARVVMLMREDEQGTRRIYNLPLRRVGPRWFQTDILAKDEGVYPILDRVATAVMERRVKRGR